MPVPQPIQQALDLLDRVGADDVRLFVVRRVLKGGLRTRSRAANKYDYTPLKALPNEDARLELLSGIRGHVAEAASAPDLELREYDLIEADDEDSVYSYPSVDLARLSFASSINEIRGDTSSLPRAAWDDEDIGDLHGYALVVSDGESDLLLFNRIRPQNVHHPLTPSKRLFGISGKELQPVQRVILSFDVRISCLVINGSLIILSKKRFEDLVGFTEELQQSANQVVDNLQEIGLLSGLDVLRAELDKSAQLLRKLAALAKKGHLDSMSPARIERMKQMASEYGLQLPLDSRGRLVITDRKDIPHVIKWLSDNFVVSPQTSHLYDAAVKSRLNT